MWEPLVFLLVFLLLFPTCMVGGVVLAVKLMERFLE